ncbi:hypothetical protein PRIC1_014261 [Phytophthora ramorum]
MMSSIVSLTAAGTKAPSTCATAVIFRMSNWCLLVTRIPCAQTLEEILQAVAKAKTRDARRAMSYLHADEFVDTQMLLAFPTSAEHKTPTLHLKREWLL